MKTSIEWKDKKIWLWALGVFLIFTAGYFIFFGKLAAQSGSWKYIQYHDDEYRYWVDTKSIADGYFEDNPFYFEELGRAHPFPQPASSLIGWLARIFHLHVLDFFPVWHIGLPFVLWLSLFLCLKHFWRYPAGASAAFSMLLLTATLFLRGQVALTAHRFSRPGDALWLMFICVSMLMTGKEKSNKRLAFLGAGSGLIFWLNPFMGSFMVMIIALEAVWQFFLSKDRPQAFYVAKILFLTVAAAVVYCVCVKSVTPQDSWLWSYTAPNAKDLFRIHWPPVILSAAVTSLFFFFNKGLKLPVSALDRLVLFTVLPNLVLAHLENFVPANRDWTGHQYQYFTVQISVITGWLCEKMPALIRHPFFRRVEKVFIPALLAAAIFIVWHPQTSFLRQPHAEVFKFFDNSLLILSLLPWLFLALWPLYRFERVRQFVFKPVLTLPFLLLFSMAAFFQFPSQLELANRDFPYGGAYDWLSKNGQRNEVVLTASALLTQIDYLLLYTPMRTYMNWLGNISTNSAMDASYRARLHTALLLGQFSQDKTTLRKQITHFRLNYILASRQGPFTETVTQQLGPYVEEVFQDSRCVLWRIHPDRLTP